MLEHERFGLDAEHAWLGLTQQVALESVAMTALGPDDISALRTRWLGGSGVRSALPAEASKYFTAEVVDTRDGPARLDAGFSVLVVVDGTGSLARLTMTPCPWRLGQTFLIPHAVGDLVVDGAVTALRCSPSREPGPVRA